MATTILKNIKEAPKGKASQHLINSIKYIMNPDKTEGGLWVGSFMADELRMLKLVKDRSLVDITKLPSRSFIEKIYSMDSQMDEKRISAICDAYERKIDLFRMYQLGEDLNKIKFAVNTKTIDNTEMDSYVLDDESDDLEEETEITPRL